MRRFTQEELDACLSMAKAKLEGGESPKSVQIQIRWFLAAKGWANSSAQRRSQEIVKGFEGGGS